MNNPMLKSSANRNSPVTVTNYKGCGRSETRLWVCIICCLCSSISQCDFFGLSTGFQRAVVAQCQSRLETQSISKLIHVAEPRITLSLPSTEPLLRTLSIIMPHLSWGSEIPVRYWRITCCRTNNNRNDLVLLLTSGKQDDKLACLLQVRFCCSIFSEIFDFRVWEPSKLQIVHWAPISGCFWDCYCVGKSVRVSRHISGYCAANRAVSTHPFTPRAIMWTLYLILLPTMLQLRILERVTKGPTIRRTQSQNRLPPLGSVGNLIPGLLTH